MSDWSAWAWLGFAVVAVLVVGGLVFVLTAVLSGAREGALRAKAEADDARVCPRCGHPVGQPWPIPDPTTDAGSAP